MNKKDNDPFGFNKAINWDKLEDPKVLKELDKSFEDEEEKESYLDVFGHEQKTRASNGPRLPAALAMAPGSGTKLQATSRKLQASSRKLDKKEL